MLQITFSGVEELIPTYATLGSSGADLRANIESDLLLKVGERKLVSSGISIQLPEGYEAQVRPRSGLAYKKGITVLNSPGTIDSDYRGEIGIVLINLGLKDVIIKPKERIAQLVIAPYIQSEFKFVPSLDDSERGSGGYGSTGAH